MYAVVFKANIKNGLVHIPKEYQELQEKKDATFFVLIDNKKIQ